MWANLVGPDGKVITSVKVNSDGTFNLIISKSLLSASGTYSLIFTNTPQTQGAALTNAETPANGYGYTGTNRGSGATADPANRTGLVSLGDLSTAANNSTTSAVNVGISNDPAVLPVVFGAISANWTGSSLHINWTTEAEKNNDFFDIEASANGVDFVSIGTVKSKAPNGTSDTAIQYELIKELNNNTLASILGIGMLALGSIGVYRNRKMRLPFTLLIMCGLTTLLFGCKKANSDELNGNGNALIRITQVDKDGSRSSSKTVKIVKQ